MTSTAIMPQSFQQYRQDIHAHLENLLPDRSDTLSQAARYAVLGGGKRMRPLLALVSTEAFGASKDLALQPACALELIHCYSLIHDDLPCMDDDDFRRGLPTVHKAYSEDLAVLTGDYLLTYAFEVLSTAPLLTAQQKIDLIECLSKRSGARGMIGGQVLDMAHEGKQIEESLLVETHTKKTGALIAASLEFGGIIAQVDSDTLALLHQLGLTVGLAFQVVDDILDVTHGDTKHGKKGGTDSDNNKSTYVTAYGLSGAQKKVEVLREQCQDLLQKISVDKSRLQELLGNLIDRTS